MSAPDNQGPDVRLDSATPTGQPPAAPDDARPEGQLAELMAHGAIGPATGVPGADAERAAEQAIAAGERALAAARAHFQRPQPTTGSRRRERLVRALLALDGLAMLLVALLWAVSRPDAASREGAPERVAVPRTDDSWTQALAAAAAGRDADAIAILERHLAAAPDLPPSQQASVLLALAHYSFRSGDDAGARRFEQRAQAITGGTSLPAGMEAMAAAALANGDRQGLRAIFAQCAAEQRVLPAWLYRAAAAAWLELGDGHDGPATAAAERARRDELAAIAAALRAEVGRSRIR